MQTAATPMFPTGGGGTVGGTRYYSPTAAPAVGSTAGGYKTAAAFPEPGKNPGGAQGPGGRRAASPLPYQNISSSSSSTASSSPTRSLKYGATGGAERGVPEGAASNSPSFPQDALYHAAVPGVGGQQQQQQQPPSQPPQQQQQQTLSPAATPTAATSVYYAMNV